MPTDDAPAGSAPQPAQAATAALQPAKETPNEQVSITSASAPPEPVRDDEADQHREDIDADATQPEGQGQVARAKCEVCTENEHKYKCPRCFVRTCSLACSQAHKASAGCSGKRYREAYIAPSDFNEASLLSDYRLLEQVSEAGEAAARGRAAQRREFAAPKPFQQLPKPLQNLVQAARRAGVTLTLMSPGMQRRLENSSHFVKAAQRVFWHLELSFQPVGVRHCIKAVDSGQSMSQVLAGVLTYTEGQAELHHKLRDFVDAGPSGCSCFLVKEGAPSNAAFAEKNLKIELSASLESALQGQAVLEYPRFLILLDSQSAAADAV